MDAKIVIFLMLMIARLNSAVCLPPASSRSTESPDPDDYDESSKSKASTSDCRPVNMTDAQRGPLINTIRGQLGYIHGNMSSMDIVISEDVTSTIGFYPGKNGRSHKEVLAFGVPFSLCSLKYTLDIVKRELSSYRTFDDNDMTLSYQFHAVYDVMDPANPSKLIQNLERLVHFDQLNGCTIPAQTECSSIEPLTDIGLETFVAKVKTSLHNLSEDLQTSLNALY